MKKTYTLLFALVALLATLSCDNESDTNVNQLGIVSDNPYIYADQKADSFQILSNKDWKATVDVDWASLPYSSSFGTCRDASEVSVFSCCINFETNATGRIRYAILKAENGDHGVSRTYLQTYWHNITYPAVSYTGSDFEDATFRLLATTNGGTYTVKFTLYQGATLTTQDSWINLPASDFEKGKNTVDVIVEANETGEERTGLIKLKSADGTVTSTIQVIQAQ